MCGGHDAHGGTVTVAETSPEPARRRRSATVARGMTADCGVVRRVIAVAVLGCVLAACRGDDRTTDTTGRTAPSAADATTLPLTTTAPAGTTAARTSVAGTAPSWPPAPTGCPDFTEAATASNGGPLGVTPDTLGEVSGMAVSHTNPGRLWVHNDSGDRARIYLVGEDLTIRTTVDLPDVFALDWEAMSAGPGPDGEPWLWVADTGDNLLVRPFVELHGFPEPVLGSDPPATASAGPVVTLRVRYPAGPTDVEAFAVDPRTGDGIIFAKTLDANGRSDVLRIPAASLREGGDVVAELVGSVVVTNGETGARTAASG